MFSVGDEIECIFDGANQQGWMPPIRKGERFTAAGVFPVGADVGQKHVIMEPCIAIGKENVSLREWIEARCGALHHYDLWPAERFRKIERKRTSEELHALIGIAGLVGTRAPELV